LILFYGRFIYAGGKGGVGRDQEDLVWFKIDCFIVHNPCTSGTVPVQTPVREGHLLAFPFHHPPVPATEKPGKNLLKLLYPA
jgi:hypothetical protein